jgi:hypothetical protein
MLMQVSPLVTTVDSPLNPVFLYSMIAPALCQGQQAACDWQANVQIIIKNVKKMLKRILVVFYFCMNVCCSINCTK